MERAGTSVFGSQKKDDDDEGGADEEYEPDVHFKPVIPLPELIEVKTGEEDEEVLFSNRAKLFRFVTETKEWKERGIGDFKILKNKESGKVRFLMRREQVLKVCCNHYLARSMEFKPLSSSDKAWQWSAPDFAEGEVVNELFALRFKTAELANDWKKVVDDCQAKLVDTPVKGSKVEETKPAASNKTAGNSLAQFAAAQKAASWECPACLTRNDNSRIQCMACEAPRPGYEDEVKKLKEKEEAAKPAPVMTIGAGGGFKFGSGTTSSSSGFSFGGGAAAAVTASTAASATTAAASSSTISFGTKTTTAASSGFSFGSPSVASSTSSAAAAAPKASLGGFSFSAPPVVSKKEESDTKDDKKEEKKEAEAKPSIFSAFSFGSKTE